MGYMHTMPPHPYEALNPEPESPAPLTLQILNPKPFKRHLFAGACIKFLGPGCPWGAAKQDPRFLGVESGLLPGNGPDTSFEQLKTYKLHTASRGKAA